MRTRFGRASRRGEPAGLSSPRPKQAKGRADVRWTPLAALVALLLCLTSPLSASDWPNWRGPQRDGISRESGLSFAWPAGGPKALWNAAVGTGFSSLAIADGRVFTMGNEGDRDFVRCLDANTGKLIWKQGYDCPLDPNLFEGGPTSTPTVAGDRVYTISRLGQVHCLGAADGEILWSRDLAAGDELSSPGWGYAGSPVIHGKLVLLNVGESGMALDKATGETVWQSEPEEAGYSSPVVFQHAGRDLGVFSSGKYFSAVDLASGERVWSHRWLTRYGMNACDPLIDGDLIFITSGYGKGCALVKHAAEEPEELWKGKALRSQLTVPVKLGGFVYGIDGDENAREPSLKCVSFATGEEQWAEAGVGFGSLIAAGDKLIVLSAKGELITGQATAQGWKELGRAEVLKGKCWTPPALAEGRLYCRNAFGDVVCLDLRSPRS